MIHGWSWSIGDFYEYGWVQNLRDSYELILIDARGMAIVTSRTRSLPTIND